MNVLKKRWQASRFYRGEQDGNGPVVLNHRRIFILPTGRGLGFGVLMLVLLAIAFVYNNNLVYLLTFLLAGIFFISILYCYKSISGLIVYPGNSYPVFVGESASFVIHVDNPTPTDRAHIGISGQPQVEIQIKAGGSSAVTLLHKTRKRGWLEIGTVTLFSTFPSGLFKAWSPVCFNRKVLVYPWPGQSALPFPRVVSEKSDTLSGESRLGRDGEDFYGLQEYQSGDSIKRIHWKAYAKGQGLFSKQYGGENSVQIWLDYAETPGSDIELRLSQLCRWVIDADKAGQAFGFTLPGVIFEPDCSERHVKQCLEALALF